MKAACSTRIRSIIPSWGTKTKGPDKGDNNNTSRGRPDNLPGLGVTGSPSKWISQESLLRSRSSPILDTAPRVVPSDLKMSRWQSLPSQASRESWCQDECAMTSQVRCRSAILVFTFVVLFNIVLFVILHAGSPFGGGEDVALGLQRTSLDDAMDSHLRLPRSVKVTVNSAESHMVRQDNDAGPKVRSPKKEGPGNHPLQRGCRSGHIQGFSPVCDIHGCLKKLSVEPSDRVSLPRPQPFDPKLRGEISYIPGFMDSVHLNIITVLTDMQWHHNIYGSVGEVGAQFGKFSSVLAFNYNQDCGEKLFVSDNFSQSLNGLVNVPIVQFDVFHKLMTRKGFGFNSGDPTIRRIYLHDGPHSDLSKGLLVDWDVPQFRLFSIGHMGNAVNLLQVLEMATCVLRDGGILVVDGVHHDSTKGPIVSIIAKYFHIHGTSAITPFLVARNKLYLVTTNWRERYSRYMTQHQDILLALRIRGVTNWDFGQQFSYFRIGF